MKKTVKTLRENWFLTITPRKDSRGSAGCGIYYLPATRITSRAFSIMVSFPFDLSFSVMETKISGSIPNSICSLLTLYMGDAENRTDQPLGNSDENGKPLPPPVLSPIMVAFGACFITFTKSLVAL